MDDDGQWSEPTRASVESFLYLNALICIICVAVTICGECLRVRSFNRLVEELQLEASDEEEETPEKEEEEEIKQQ